MEGPAAPEVRDWVTTRLDLITHGLRRARSIAKTSDDAEAATWLLGSLEACAEIERAAHDIVHLLTWYANRDQIARPAAVARASGVTIATAGNRVSQETAAKAAREIWPQSR
jgi:hypothetical protein